MTNPVNQIVTFAKKFVITFSNGVKVINTTPHPLTFLDGEDVVTVPTSGIQIDGKAVESDAGLHEHAACYEGIVTLVKTEFVGYPQGFALLKEMNDVLGDEVLFIGSIIAAQAYPGAVLAMVPAPGFERVPPAEKRMSCSKFTTF